MGREAQDIFDALDKQFSARWNGKDIIVMERVVVRAPGYRGEDCRVVTKDGEGLLGRVKKVVSLLLSSILILFVLVEEGEGGLVLY